MKTKKSFSNGLCHVIQHAAFALAVAFAVLAVFSSRVRITTMEGTTSYYLTGQMQQEDFADSDLFMDLFENQIYHIVRYGTIRSQLETNGKLDLKKEIDITAYANRLKGVPADEYITASYYLEDLIRWGQYGIQYETCDYMSGEEADAFLSRTRTVARTTSINTGKDNIFNSDLSRNVQIMDVSGNSIYGQDMVREDVYGKQLLVNRYPTVDGKNIEDCVSSWEEYDELCANLGVTVTDLLENYDLYERYQEYYDSKGDAAKSNVIYVIRKVIGNKTIVYTNLSTTKTDLDALKKAVKDNCQKYVYYAPDTMEYETNTSLEEAFVRNKVNQFGYAYPENMQLIIGVADNRAVSDCFVEGKTAYDTFMPNFPQAILWVVVFSLIFLTMVILLTIKEGADGKLKPEDKIATEWMLLLAGIVIVTFAKCYSSLGLMEDIYADMSYGIAGIVVFSTIGALVLSLIGSFFYYSFVRRIRTKILWKNSILYRLCQSIRKGFLGMMNHKSVVVRVILPFAAFTFCNFLGCFAVIMGYYRKGSFFAVMITMFLLIADILAGVIVFRHACVRQEILQVIHRICNGDLSAKVPNEGLYGENRVLAEAVNCIGESVRISVETSMKDERLKADLITNVSHDIKTPLTSIINYVDLIKRENIDDPKIQEYIHVLDTKSQRLKQLTDDLVEASKISSGNIVLHMEKINLMELLHQAIGEFSEKFEKKMLSPMLNTSLQSVYILADSRRIWRVMENLFNNIFKYALEGTRVYIDLAVEETGPDEKIVVLSIKNISATELNVSPEELTERFIRGDESRTTEGSGLGLSIAKNLTEAMNGSFEISIDGDLFKVTMRYTEIDA